MTVLPKHLNRIDLPREQREVSGEIDTSLIEYSLQLTYEERIEANDSALELVRELKKAGQNFYARKSEKLT